MELQHRAEERKPHSLDAASQRLLDWGAANGVFAPKIRYPVEFASGLRGVEAAEFIGPDEDIIRMPQSLLLTSDSAANSPVADFFQTFPNIFLTGPKAEMHRFIAFMIRETQRSDSFWASYIDLLPKDMGNTSDWTQEELLELQDSLLMQEAQEDHTSQLEMWAQLKEVLETRPDLFSPEGLSFTHFRHVYGIITTRCFMRFNQMIISAPVADMLNHGLSHTYYDVATEDTITPRRPSEVDYEDAPSSMNLYLQFEQLGEIVGSHHAVELDSDAKRLQSLQAAELDGEKWAGPFEINRSPDAFFRIRTGKNECYEPGSQVCLFYGNLSNRYFISASGFATRHDHFSFYYYSFLPSQLATDGDLVRRLEESAYNKVYQIKLRRKFVSIGLIRTLRCLLWTPASPAAAFSRPLDWKLELKVAQRARDLLTEELHKFPTSIEEDEALLATDLPIRLRFAIYYRINLKESLRAQISAFSRLAEVVTSLDGGETAAAAVARYREAGEQELEPYFKEVA